MTEHTSRFRVARENRARLRIVAVESDSEEACIRPDYAAARGALAELKEESGDKRALAGAVEPLLSGPPDL